MKFQKRQGGINLDKFQSNCLLVFALDAPLKQKQTTLNKKREKKGKRKDSADDTVMAECWGEAQVSVTVNGVRE